MPPRGWSKAEGKVVSPTSGKRKRQMMKYWRKLKKLKDPLTEREKQVLYFIRTHQAEERYSPTIQHIAAIFFMPHSNAADLVRRLEAKGFIELTEERRIMFPKGIRFPWHDEKQFPRTVFLPPKDISIEGGIDLTQTTIPPDLRRGA